MNPIKSKVTLEYRAVSIGDQPYRIAKVTNDIGVSITPGQFPSQTAKEPRRYYVGDYITEAQASELLSEPGIEVTTVPGKDA